MKTITINGEELRLKQTLRSLFVWEQITGRSFEIKSTMDNYIYFFAILLANNPDMSLTWDAFIDALDTDPAILTKFNTLLMESQERDRLFDSEEEGAQAKKKE